MTTKKNTPRVTFLDPAGALRALIDAIETAASELRRALPIIRNQQVVRSTRIAGSKFTNKFGAIWALVKVPC